VPFTAASPASLTAFLAVEAGVLSMFVLGVRKADRAAAPRVLALTFAWLALLGVVVATGVVADEPMPRLPVLLAFTLGCGVAFGFSRTGGRLAQLPLPALVMFQAFRLPLEFVLHAWAESGTVPPTMTWTGQNFDVVSGALALVAAPFAGRIPAAAWLANGVGIVLLANVLRVVVLSSPLPFAWPIEPPLQLAFHLPYASILPVCVTGALVGHIVLTRALLRRR
jgi:hypothetical protein